MVNIRGRCLAMARPQQRFRSDRRLSSRGGAVIAESSVEGFAGDQLSPRISRDDVVRLEPCFSQRAEEHIL